MTLQLTEQRNKHPPSNCYGYTCAVNMSSVPMPTFLDVFGVIV